MIELVVLFSVLGLVGLYAVVTVMRREKRRSGSSDGILVELERTEQLARDRVSYSSNAVHNNPYTTGL